MLQSKIVFDASMSHTGMGWECRRMQASGIEIDAEDRLHRTLQKYSGRHVHFFPNFGNCGDGFIAYATYKMFDAYNIQVTTHRQNELLHDCIVFVGGGGNLLEGIYDHSARIISAHCAHNEVILLPHTIVGNHEILQETHRNLQIFCREPKSYAMALEGPGNRGSIHLAEDMTFYLRDDHFDAFRAKGSGLLCALRSDGESTGALDLPDDNVDISRAWDGDIWGSRLFTEHATKSLFAFVSQFDTVLTDRLHVAIIGSFLNKRVVFMPNSYFKNSAIYAHSLQHRFPLTEFGETDRNVNLMASYGMTLAKRQADEPGTGAASGQRRPIWLRKLLSGRSAR